MDTRTEVQYKLYQSDLADRAIAAGLKQRYLFTVVGHGPVPTAPYYHGLFYVEPVLVPPRGGGRLLCLSGADIDILGYVLIHDPKVAEEKRDFKIPLPSIPAATILTVGALVVGGVVLTTAIMALGAVTLMPAAVLSVGLADPQLICVLSDLTWLQVDSWYD